MLMMLGVLKGAMVKPGPADAHDAGALRLATFLWRPWAIHWQICGTWLR